MSDATQRTMNIDADFYARWSRMHAARQAASNRRPTSSSYEAQHQYFMRQRREMRTDGERTATSVDNVLDGGRGTVPVIQDEQKEAALSNEMSRDAALSNATNATITPMATKAHPPPSVPRPPSSNANNGSQSARLGRRSRTMHAVAAGSLTARTSAPDNGSQMALVNGWQAVAPVPATNSSIASMTAPNRRRSSAIPTPRHRSHPSSTPFATQHLLRTHRSLPSTLPTNVSMEQWKSRRNEAGEGESLQDQAKRWGSVKESDQRKKRMMSRTGALLPDADHADERVTLLLWRTQSIVGQSNDAQRTSHSQSHQRQPSHPLSQSQSEEPHHVHQHHHQHQHQRLPKPEPSDIRPQAQKHVSLEHDGRATDRVASSAHTRQPSSSSSISSSASSAPSSLLVLNQSAVGRSNQASHVSSMASIRRLPRARRQKSMSKAMHTVEGQVPPFSRTTTVTTSSGAYMLMEHSGPSLQQHQRQKSMQSQMSNDEKKQPPSTDSSNASAQPSHNRQPTLTLGSSTSRPTALRSVPTGPRHRPQRSSVSFASGTFGSVGSASEVDPSTPSTQLSPTSPTSPPPTATCVAGGMLSIDELKNEAWKMHVRRRTSLVMDAETIRREVLNAQPDAAHHGTPSATHSDDNDGTGVSQKDAAMTTPKHDRTTSISSIPPPTSFILPPGLSATHFIELLEATRRNNVDTFIYHVCRAMMKDKMRHRQQGMMPSSTIVDNGAHHHHQNLNVHITRFESFFRRAHDVPLFGSMHMLPGPDSTGQVGDYRLHDQTLDLRSAGLGTNGLKCVRQFILAQRELGGVGYSSLKLSRNHVGTSSNASATGIGIGHSSEEECEGMKEVLSMVHIGIGSPKSRRRRESCGDGTMSRALSITPRSGRSHSSATPASTDSTHSASSSQPRSRSSSRSPSPSRSRPSSHSRSTMSSVFDTSNTDTIEQQALQLLRQQNLSHPLSAIHSLDLSFTALTSQDFVLLASSLNATRLRRLDISSDSSGGSASEFANKLGEEGALSLARALDHPACPLHALRMGGIGSMATFLRTWRECLEQRSKKRRPSHSASSGLPTLALTSFDIRNSCLSLEGWMDLLVVVRKFMPNLERLILARNRLPSSSSSPSYSSSTAASTPSNRSRSRSQATTRTADAGGMICQLLRETKSLKILDLTACAITSQTTAITAIPPVYDESEEGKNDMDMSMPFESETQEVGPVSNDSSCAAPSASTASSSHSHHDFYSCLIESMARNPNWCPLHSLLLDENHFDSVSDIDGGGVCRSFGMSFGLFRAFLPNLKRVSLARCGIKDLSWIAYGLLRLPALTKLDLSGNEFGDGGAIALAMGMQGTLHTDAPLMPTIVMRKHARTGSDHGHMTGDETKDQTPRTPISSLDDDDEDDPDMEVSFAPDNIASSSSSPALPRNITFDLLPQQLAVAQTANARRVLTCSTLPLIEDQPVSAASYVASRNGGSFPTPAPRCPLAHLNLTHVGLGDIGSMHLAHAIRASCIQQPPPVVTLHTLRLRDNNLTLQAGLAFLEALKSCPSIDSIRIRELDLFANRVPEEVRADIQRLTRKARERFEERRRVRVQQQCQTFDMYARDRFTQLVEAVSNAMDEDAHCKSKLADIQLDLYRIKMEELPQTKEIESKAEEVEKELTVLSRTILPELEANIRRKRQMLFRAHAGYEADLRANLRKEREGCDKIARQIAQIRRSMDAHHSELDEELRPYHKQLEAEMAAVHSLRKEHEQISSEKASLEKELLDIYTTILRNCGKQLRKDEDILDPFSKEFEHFSKRIMEARIRARNTMTMSNGGESENEGDSPRRTHRPLTAKQRLTWFGDSEGSANETALQDRSPSESPISRESSPVGVSPRSVSSARRVATSSPTPTTPRPLSPHTSTTIRWLLSFPSYEVRKKVQRNLVKYALNHGTSIERLVVRLDAADGTRIQREGDGEEGSWLTEDDLDRLSPRTRSAVQRLRGDAITDWERAHKRRRSRSRNKGRTSRAATWRSSSKTRGASSNRKSREGSPVATSSPVASAASNSLSRSMELASTLATTAYIPTMAPLPTPAVSSDGSLTIRVEIVTSFLQLAALTKIIPRASLYGVLMQLRLGAGGNGGGGETKRKMHQSPPPSALFVSLGGGTAAREKEKEWERKYGIWNQQLGMRVREVRTGSTLDLPSAPPQPPPPPPAVTFTCQSNTSYATLLKLVADALHIPMDLISSLSYSERRIPIPTPATATGTGSKGTPSTARSRGKNMAVQTTGSSRKAEMDLEAQKMQQPQRAQATVSATAAGENHRSRSIDKNLRQNQDSELQLREEKGSITQSHHQLQLGQPATMMMMVMDSARSSVASLAPWSTSTPAQVTDSEADMDDHESPRKEDTKSSSNSMQMRRSPPIALSFRRDRLTTRTQSQMASGGNASTKDGSNLRRSPSPTMHLSSPPILQLDPFMSNKNGSAR